MAAIYEKPCPVCGGKMWDNKAPGGKFPWTPNKPVAKCQNKECSGAYWAGKEPSATQASVTTETLAVGPAVTYRTAPSNFKPPVVPALAVKQHFELYSEVVLAYDALLKESPSMVSQQMQEILASATGDTISMIVGGIANRIDKAR